MAMETVQLAAGQIAVACFVGLLIWASYSDAVNFIIPNRLCLAIVGLYPAHVLTATTSIDWMGGLAVGAGVFAVGYLLYARNYIGGGDAKLLAAVAIWAGPGLAAPFLVVTALSGGLVSLVEAMDLRFGRARTPDGAVMPLSAVLHVHVPYGIAVSLGGLVVAARLLPG